MSFGVTPQGFARKTLAQILGDLEEGWRGIFGTDVDLSPSTPDAQILGLFAGELDEAWQAVAAAYSSYRPRQSMGAALSDIVVFNGITRKIGTRTVVNVTLSATQPIILPSGTQVESVAGDRFEIVTPSTYFNNDAALFRAVDDGPILVAPGEITKIVTPVGGWTGVNNATAQQVIGSFDETDGELRTRQRVSTENGAVNILEALVSALLQIEGVLRVRIYVNATSGVVDGRPAHSYEVVVQGGDDTEIAEAIWANHPAGITLHGSTSVVIQDSQGTNQTINFTRPTPVSIVVDIVLSTTANYPSTGDDDIKQAILDYAAGLLVEDEEFGIGDDVLISRVYTPVNSVHGHHVTSLQIGAPTLGTANVPIDEIEIAEFTLGNITVSS